MTYAYLEKGAIVQAISGPFDLGRPNGCPPNGNSGWNRLNPKPVTVASFTEDAALVSSGVGDGDRIVTLGVQKLEAGLKVRTVESQ